MKGWKVTLVAAALVSPPATSAGPAPAPAVERRAHDFAYADINPRSATHGQRLSLAELREQHGVVLNFVASWCAPCWIELPGILKVGQAIAPKIVLVAADEYGAPEDLLRLAAGAAVDLPIVLVPPAEIATMERHYDHELLPSTWIIDRGGVVRAVLQGMVSEERLLEETRRHLTPPAPRS